MPNLFIRYGDLVLHDGDVDSLDWTDAPGVVTVTGKLTKPAAAGGGLLDLISAASRRQSETRRAELAATVDAEEAS